MSHIEYFFFSCFHFIFHVLVFYICFFYLDFIFMFWFVTIWIPIQWNRQFIRLLKVAAAVVVVFFAIVGNVIRLNVNFQSYITLLVRVLLSTVCCNLKLLLLLLLVFILIRTRTIGYFSALNGFIFECVDVFKTIFHFRV